MNLHDEPVSKTVFKIYLLGELRIIHNQELVPPPPYRTHSLLAALLLHPKPLRRERLGTLLFPDLVERDGRRRLSDLLWLLRRALPDLPLEASAQEIFLPSESRWLDVEAFSQSAHEENLSGWRQALTLYRGNLLESIYDDWLLEKREYLYLQYVHLLHQTCDWLVRKQQFTEVIPLAEQLWHIEPYDEKALRILMQTYQATGQRGAALAAYEKFLALAADELGIEPETSTHSLAEAIRKTDVLPLTARATPPSLDTTITAGTTTPYERAVRALDQGDRATFNAYLTQLRNQYSPDDHQLLDIEIDGALYSGDYERATQLLDKYKKQTAPVLVRRARLALTRRQKETALETASQALILACNTNDTASQLEALLILAHSQCELGQNVQGARTIKQALNLAQANESPVKIATALLTTGRIHMNLGNRNQALKVFDEARSLAQEYKLRPILAEVLYKISAVYGDQGALKQALITAREALNVWRDLGLKKQEVSTSQLLALFYALLGDTAECLRIIERLQENCKTLGDPVQIAINQYHLADTLIYHDDALAARAITVGREALAIFQAHNQPEWIASMLTTLAYSLWLEGNHEAALDACIQAKALHEELEEFDYLPGLLALKGLVHLAQQDPDLALKCTQEALQIAMLGSAVNDALPEVYYAHAMALVAHNEEEQAHDYFNRAYQHLVTEAAQHKDEDARQALFNRSPLTRRLMQELYTRGIVSPPSSNVITRQLPAAYGNLPVKVKWTVDAGPVDAALKHAQGAIALRRTRLKRLQQEAAAQGAQPTIVQLAEALNVSPRTIKRDLASLRLQKS